MEHAPVPCRHRVLLGLRGLRRPHDGASRVGGRRDRRRALASDTPTGKTVHQYVQEDVHDFAWTTSPDYIVKTEKFEHKRLQAVEMRLLIQPEHASQADRYFMATRATLRSYGEWYGPYPYGHITIVDPAFQTEAGGMEYPTLFTGGTNWLAPLTVTDPEDVTVHECGHQFWYGLVGNDEFEHAWIDEGLNTFSTARVIEETFSPNFYERRFFGGVVPWVFHDIAMPREIAGDRMAGYRTAARSDVQQTPSWRYAPGHGRRHHVQQDRALAAHARAVSGLAAAPARDVAVLHALAFKHPTPEDFFSAINEGAGRDLNWYFDQVYRSSNAFDYAVGTLTTEKRGDAYHTEVMVQRRGEALFPVDVQVMFDDGSRVREHWDGRERWKLYTWGPERGGRVRRSRSRQRAAARHRIARTTAARSRRRPARPHASGPRAGSSGCRTWCRPMRSSSESARAFWRGWTRVLLAPEAILGVWLATALAALPAAILMHDAIGAQLGSSLTASKVAAGFDYGWWEEFEAQARGVAKTLAPVVIGAAAPVSNWSSLMDGRGIPRSLLVPVAVALAVWLFLSGGLINRFARGRRIGTRAFFGTCGLSSSAGGARNRWG